jgi:hypothetical protein
MVENIFIQIGCFRFVCLKIYLENIIYFPHLNLCFVSEPTVEKNLQRHRKSVG